MVSCTQSAYLYVTNDLGNNNITANASSLKLNLTASTFARVSRETLYADGAALTYLLNNQAWRASLDFNNSGASPTAPSIGGMDIIYAGTQ